MGLIKARNTDGRYSKKLADGTTAKQNFRVYYEIDGETIGTVLRTDEYDGSDEFSWVLLEERGQRCKGARRRCRRRRETASVRFETAQSL